MHNNLLFFRSGPPPRTSGFITSEDDVAFLSFLMRTEGSYIYTPPLTTKIVARLII